MYLVAWTLLALCAGEFFTLTLCTAQLRGNGVCDLPCFFDRDDGGDCNRKLVCEQWKADGFCDAECFALEFEWDGGDCEECPGDWLGDGHCDLACNESSNDDGDCECQISHVADGHCDEECMSEEYEWDGGDCYADFTV